MARYVLSGPSKTVAEVEPSGVLIALENLLRNFRKLPIMKIIAPSEAYNAGSSDLTNNQNFNENSKGNTGMAKNQKMEKFAMSLGVKMAVVQVKSGESVKEAWNRHLIKNPGDASVMIKIFNQPVPLQSAAGTAS